MRFGKMGESYLAVGVEVGLGRGCKVVVVGAVIVDFGRRKEAVGCGMGSGVVGRMVGFDRIAGRRQTWEYEKHRSWVVGSSFAGYNYSVACRIDHRVPVPGVVAYGGRDAHGAHDARLLY